MGNISFQTTQRPFFLNAWTGEQNPVIYYTVDAGYTTIPFSLGYTETAIIKLCDDPTTPHKHIVSAPAGALISAYSPAGHRPVARITAAGDTNEPIVLSNGKHIKIPSAIPNVFSLRNWTLTVEQWLPAADIYDVEIDANKANVTFILSGPNLNLGLQSQPH